MTKIVLLQSKGTHLSKTIWVHLVTTYILDNPLRQFVAILLDSSITFRTQSGVTQLVRSPHSALFKGKSAQCSLYFHFDRFLKLFGTTYQIRKSSEGHSLLCPHVTTISSMSYVNYGHVVQSLLGDTIYVFFETQVN